VPSFLARLPTNQPTNQAENKQTFVVEKRDLCGVAVLNTEVFVSGLYSGGFVFENWVGRRVKDEGSCGFPQYVPTNSGTILPHSFHSHTGRSPT